MTVVRGRAWCFGDAVDTDAIMPGRFLLGDAEAAVRGVMAGVRPGFADAVEPGDVIVAGESFGIGSSRELAASALKQVGVAAVVAASFAPIFRRNCINVGLPPVICPKARSVAREGEMLALDLEAGTLSIGGRAPIAFEGLAPELEAIVAAGGLEPYLRLGLEEAGEPGAPG
jgi:3-isopropylmalate/(R)-2-methylmalate dehydratase small subunit